MSPQISTVIKTRTHTILSPPFSQSPPTEPIIHLWVVITGGCLPVSPRFRLAVISGLSSDRRGQTDWPDRRRLGWGLSRADHGWARVVRQFELANRPILQSSNRLNVKSNCLNIQMIYRSFVQTFYRPIVQTFYNAVVQSFNRAVFQTVKSSNWSIVQSFKRSTVRSSKGSIIPWFNRSLARWWNGNLFVSSVRYERITTPSSAISYVILTEPGARLIRQQTKPNPHVRLRLKPLCQFPPSFIDKVRLRKDRLGRRHSQANMKNFGGNHRIQFHRIIMAKQQERNGRKTSRTNWNEITKNESELNRSERSTMKPLGKRLWHQFS